jgi:hypothetical protein
MNILRIYVAAVCLASIVFGLHDAPLFLRARQRAANAAVQEKNSRELVKKATDARVGAAIVASFDAGGALVDDNGNPIPKNDPRRAAFDAAAFAAAAPSTPIDPKLSAALDEEENAKAAWSGAVAEKSLANDAYEVQLVYALLIGGIFLSHVALLGVATRRQRLVTASPSN